MQIACCSARLETTTIYAKVAIGKATQIESPLDRIATAGGTLNDQTTESPQPSVGMLRMEVAHPTPDEQGTRSSRCRVFILQPTETLELTDICLRESRPGWLALDVPPLEAWQPVLARLTSTQRQRLIDPSFYDLLHHELTRRFMAFT